MVTSRFTSPASHAPLRKKIRQQRAKIHQIVQPKLTIGQPNDKYEQEADTVANKVFSNHRALSVEKKDETIQANLIQQKGEERINRALDYDGDFDDCDRKGGTAEREQIEEAHDEAIRLLRSMTQLLIKNPEHLSFGLHVQFGISDLNKPADRKKLDGLIYKLGLARIGLQKKSFNYECDYYDDLNFICEKKSHIAGVGFATDIHICPAFFSRISAKQAQTIIHEALHKFAGVGHGKPLNNSYKIADFVATDNLKPLKPLKPPKKSTKKQ